ncbi:hypothetical protein ACWT_6935 [Actinoplanes sp. SE50]|uniref:hypothetical protein n=1 Tax=unclassified Actinoplanes TaxID=2626549 RepID=UPI00023EBC61|nr:MULTISPECIES: hypothetical protein [unclassified Actinoplanes]AEV87946.1 hypothetical protein ACPL_7066 [Actinoplanes sp. SE50/110]ATO86350.1 hypothetical protein ACWT_6935 [Actinoplanes sp. SE50]SLM03765.1 hypothetical protein ACSP50_7064 [Actinoplanes sp. SE50/110]
MEDSRFTRANLLFVGLIAVLGVGAFFTAVQSGRQDSALLFVAFPTVLAVLVALYPTGTTHGTVFRFTTVALLVCAVQLHEGAICVVLAAPLVYLVAHGVTGLVRMSKRRGNHLYALLPLPLLLVGSAEGTSGDLRIHPDQSVEVTRVVALAPDQVRAVLEAGPQPTATRSLPLRLLDVPVPEHVHGDGLAPGDRWTFVYHGSSHGPGGDIVTRVTDAGPARVTWSVIEDTSITGRWVGMRDATLTWHTVPAGTSITLRVDYRRGLDPSWYFGPLQDGLMHAGAEHLLDMLSLR